jgi:hypothetical protein
MSNKSIATIATMGIDIGKNSFLATHGRTIHNGYLRPNRTLHRCAADYLETFPDLPADQL